ncbi:mechanosensitive ion channel family protein [Pseudocolwellia agarivorans]|uniref:mechanosensitive ion channel family protein n=1 Tax=Pseudocolwellia agarivorans TaxID=1911682 RepID=UPI000985F018|nr:mechanosensitive ion channel domain-containing protein [Pseudocolwellia agarivorans]
MTLEQASTFLNTSILVIGGQPLTLKSIILIPVWIMLGLWLTKILIKFISRRLVSRHTDPNVIHLLQRLFYVVAITILVITILDLINVPITAFAFLSGAIAIGFGFGAQNIINNFISGWILMWEKPIRIGDFLEVDNAKGIVEKINTRSTRIRRTDGVHLLIPNSKLLENTVVNWTLVDRLVRTSVRIGVAYGTSAKLVAKLLQQVIDNQENILSDPKPIVTFEDFGDNALIFEAVFWINSNVEGGLRTARSEVRFQIDELFTQHNIVIAFPQRDVHIDGSLMIKKVIE